MTKILIPHGITPTGIGVRLRTNGTLRAISPCCGRSMQNVWASCKGCSATYGSLAEDIDASLIADIVIKSVGWHESAVAWIRNVTGIPNLEVNIK